MLSLRAIVLSGIVLATGCVADPPEPPAPRPDIVIYVVDTLRADRLGVYSRRPSLSPALDRFAEEGIVFDRASAPAPWTLPSAASMLLSQLPCEHGLLEDGHRIAADARPLALVLSELGYRSASFFANPYVGPMSGLDRGFDEVRLATDADVEALGTQWVAAQEDDTPLFAYLHTVEPHNPESAPSDDVSDEHKAAVDRAYREYRNLTRVDYDAEQPLGTTDNTAQQAAALEALDDLKDTIDALYDAAVVDADARFGRVRAALEATGRWDEALVIFVSDHGEELGDRGGWQHDQSVYEELMRVPLIVKLPGRARAGERVETPVSLVDVLPTLLGYLQLDASMNTGGRDLLGELDDELRFVGMRENRKKYYRPYDEARGDVNVVVRRGRWKGIWNADVDTVELYDLARDPGEQDPLEPSDITDAIRVFAEKALGRCRAGASVSPEASDRDLDDETRRRLESLGYVSPPG